MEMKPGIVKKFFVLLLLCFFFMCSSGSSFCPALQAQVQADAKIQDESTTGDTSAVKNKQAQADRKFSSPDAGNKTDENKKIFLFDWFRRGGLFMWPILICAALGMGLVIERFIFYRKAKLNPREFIEEFDQVLKNGTTGEAETLCKEKNMVISRILLKGLKLRSLGLDHVEKGISAAGSIEIASLEKGLSVLSAVGNIAPLLGFLGTVSGMITAFQSIAVADQVSARLVAGGIYEALITTEAGLIIAIPVLAFYNYFIHRIEAFVADIERISADIVEKLLGENGKN